jgi:hypothetical protein
MVPTDHLFVLENQCTRSRRFQVKCSCTPPP